MTVSTRYERLAEDTRDQRRSIADAIEVLGKFAGFGGSARATLWVAPLFHLFGRPVYLVNLQFRAHYDLVFLVSLPTAIRSRAIVAASSLVTEVHLEELDGATVDVNANVHLHSGRILRGVDVEPAHLPYDPSKLEWRIICLLAKMQNAETRCFPFWRDKAPAEIREMIPAHLRMPDCQAIAQLKAPPLKVLQGYLADLDPPLKISMQKIADTLAIFGVRPVRPRPRKGRSP